MQINYLQDPVFYNFWYQSNIFLCIDPKGYLNSMKIHISGVCKASYLYRPQENYSYLVKIISAPLRAGASGASSGYPAAMTAPTI